MAKNGKVLETIIRIGGQMDASVQKSIKKTSDSINSLGAKFGKIQKAAALAGAAMAAAFAAAAVKIGKDSVESAAAFEKQMSNVATLLDGDIKKRVGELGDEVLKVSKATGASTDDLTDGLYQVISAFGDSADSIKIMDTAARAAVAGNASTTNAINLLSAVTKGYGDTSAEANAKAADLAFTTVKLGQTSFSELAAAMGRVIPLASTMSIKQEELFGAMATLTGVTGNTAEVTTQLRGTIQGFLQPTKDMQEAIEELGYTDGKAMLANKGLAESLLMLKDFVKGDEIAFSSLFGSIEAKNAVLALTGAQLDAFREKSAAMYDEANGAASRAFDAQTDNIHGIVKKMKAYWNATLIEVGNAVLPIIKELAEKALPKMQKAMDAFRDNVKGWVTKLREWAATIDWSAMVQKFKATMAVMRDDIVKCALALKEWAQSVNWREVAKTSIQTIISLKNAISKFYAFIQDNKDTLATLAKITVAFMAICKVISIVITVFTTLKTIFVTIGAYFTVIKAAIFAVGTILVSTTGLVVLAIAAIGVALWALWAYWDEVCAWCGAAWDATCEACSSAWNATCQWCRSAWDGVCSKLAAAWESIKSAWNASCEWCRSVWDSMCAGLGSAWDSTVGSLNSAWEGIKSAWNSSCQWVSNLWNGLCNGLTSAWNSVASTFVSAWNGIKVSIQTIISSIMSYLQPLIDKVQGLMSGLQSAKETLSNSKLNPTNWFAAGGFTSGPSICGEAGTEAVISFDPAYRRENQGYLMTAAQMLGMTAAPVQNTSVTYNLGGINFSPVVKVGDNANRGDALRQLRACMPELIDLIESAMSEKNSHSYA